MSAFAAAVATRFADPNLAVDALYTPVETGVAVTVRGIVRAPDTVTPIFGASLASDTVMVEVRCAEVAEPVEGDMILIGGEDRIVQGQPRRDALRLVWILDTRPA